LEICTDFYDELSGLMDESPHSITTPATVIDGQVANRIEENLYDLYSYAVARHSQCGDGCSEARMQAHDTTLEWDGANWWRVTRAWWDARQYSPRTNVISERLTGFTSGNTLHDVLRTDSKANLTTIQVTLDQANKKQTAVTNTPRSQINITGVTINGLLQSVNSESCSGLNYFYYDPLRRPVATKDPLGFVTGSALNPTNGWVMAATNAAGKVTQFDYNHRGQPTLVRGEVPYPEKRVYNQYGDLTELRTYRGGANRASASWPGEGETADVTTWDYDPATGLALRKSDPSGRGCTNLYHWTRTLWTRTWARGLVVTNTFNVFGDLLARH
jgi:hypothetical protein